MSHSLWVYPVLISPIFIGYNSQAAGESSIIKESITSCSDICSTFWKIIRRIKFTNDGFFGITNERIRSIKLTLRPIICTTIVTGVSARCSIFKCPIIWFLTIKITTDTMNSILIFSIGTIQRFSKFYLEALKRDTCSWKRQLERTKSWKVSVWIEKSLAKLERTQRRLSNFSSNFPTLPELSNFNISNFISGFPT